MARKSIAKNAAFNSAYKMLNILFPLVTSVYLSRVLGPTYLGRVNYAHSIMSYFLVVASLGIPTYGMREIARAGENTETRNKVFSELFIINFCATVLCSCGFLFLVFMVPSLRDNIPLYLCTGVTLFLNVFNIDWFYSGQEEYVYITIRSFIIKILSIIMIFVFVRGQSDYIIYALITSLAVTGNYIWNVINLKGRVKFRFSHLKFSPHLKPALLLLVTLLATDLYNQIDVTMIGAMCTDTDVGYYTNGIKIIRIVYSLTTAISATILPRMCFFFKEKNKEEFMNLFWNTLGFVILISVPCSIGLFLVAKPVVYVMFGSKFSATAPVIMTLCPIVFIISFSYLIGSVVLTATQNEKYLLVATITGAIINAFLNYILIRKIGILGAATASVIGELTVAIIHAYYGWNYVRKKISRRFVVSLGLAILMLCFTVVITNMFITNAYLILLVSVVSGAIIYFGALLLLKNPTALLAQKSMLKKINLHKQTK